MTCPRCGHVADPALSLKGVHLCAQCGMAVVDERGGWRQAMFRDLDDLTPSELQQLRAVSAPLMRPGTSR